MTAFTAATPDDLPEFPTWVGNSALLFDTSPGTEGDATGWLAGVWETPIAATPLIGPAGAPYATGVGFADLDFHPAPSYTSGHLFRIVSFGGPVGAGERIPRVTSLIGASEEEFTLPADTTDVFTGCHHPAWNVEGTEILCTRQDDGEDYQGSKVQDTHRLFRFAWDGAGWVNAGAMVEALADTEIDTIPDYGSWSGGVGSGVFPTYIKGESSCRNYTWKYGQWCGSDDFAVATLFCMDEADLSGLTVLSSRVVLIDVSAGATSADDYLDLTSLVEDELDWPRGTYNGIFSTCAAVPEDDPVSPEEV